MSPIKSQQVLAAIINKIGENIKVDEFFQTTLQLLGEYLSADGCLVIEENLNLETKVYCCYLSPIFCQEDELIKTIQEISEFYYPSLIKDNYLFISQEDKRCPVQLSLLFKQNNLKSLLLLPIIHHQDYFGQVGCYWYNYSDPRSQEELMVVQAIATQSAIFLYQTKLKKIIEETPATIAPEINLNKNDYLSHVSHEIRTPINAIIGFSKMLKKQLYGQLNAKQLQYVKGIYDSGIFLLDLINDLLDISKIEARKEELFIEKIILEDLCKGAIFLVQEIAREQGLNLSLIIDSQVNYCLADKVRLKQILVNLLSNAVKFTERGSVILKVESKPQELEFSVIDTGIGIKKSEQGKLFKPFCQLNSHLHHKRRGTGLGLALSRKLARLHGGDITLISEEGKGSCFTLHLPLNNNNLE